MCKQCNKNPVFISKINKVKYCKSCFNKYFEKKVRKTIRVNKLINKKEKITIAIKATSSLTILFLIKKILRDPKIKIIKTKKFTKKTITGHNLDNEAENILTSYLNKTKYISSPKQTTIKPLYYMTEEEVRIFAKLNKIKLTKQKQSKITKLLNKLEQKHPGTKYAIVNSANKLINLSFL